MEIPKGKRILMLLENMSYPKDFRVRREASALLASGYRVTVISPAQTGQPRRELVKGVAVYRFPSPPEGNGTLGYVWEYFYSTIAIFFISLYVLFHEGFDVVHVHQPPDTLALIAGFYKLFGKKYVFDHHDLSPELYDARFHGKGKAIVRKTLILLEVVACRLADHVIATNQSYKRIEMERGGIRDASITIVRNGPSLEWLFRCKGDPILQKEEKILIGYEGVIGVQDGVDYLLRAIRHLVFNLGRRDIFCLIVGSGAAMPSIQLLAQELGVNEFVYFTGWVDGQAEVWRYLSSMDICVAPEPSDPYNVSSTAAKIMEYMAAGKPIVAFDLLEHHFTAQEAALYARPNDESDFARKIECLVDDPHRRDVMGKTGRERIASELAWEYQAAYLIEAYQLLFQR